MNRFQIERTDDHGSIDVDLPLHPRTDNGEHVALLVQRILTAVGNGALGTEAPSHADVVQALTIATALRAALAEVSARAGGAVTMDLLDIAVEQPRQTRRAA